MMRAFSKHGSVRSECAHLRQPPLCDVDLPHVAGCPKSRALDQIAYVQCNVSRLARLRSSCLLTLRATKWR
mgnify:CR=1 FL=1|jgi:hypothetical protein